MLNRFELICSHVEASWMEPVFAQFTLHHQIVGIIGHFAFTIHGNPIRREPSLGSLVLKTTEIILRPYRLQLRVILKAVHGAFTLDRVRALDIIVIRQEEFFEAVKLPPSTDRFLGTIIPPHVRVYVLLFSVDLDALYSRYVRRFLGILGAHQHAVPGFNDLVRALDSVRLQDLLRCRFGFRHQTLTLRPSPSA